MLAKIFSNDHNFLILDEPTNDLDLDTLSILKKVIKNPEASLSEKRVAVSKLDSLPKSSSPIRIRNRCFKTGRPRGVIRRFNLSRISFREMALKGEIPGVTKASW